MDNKAWLEERINDLIKKTEIDTFLSIITDKDVSIAKELIKINAYSTIDFFIILTSINLLNAAIKRPEYKNELTYASIKGNVSRILHYLISLDFNKYHLDFSINPNDKCAYVEVYKLQFSFHNININEKIRGFIWSDSNRIKSWKGIRLQKIAGELFNLSLLFRDMEIKEDNLR